MKFSYIIFYYFIFIFSFVNISLSFSFFTIINNKQNHKLSKYNLSSSLNSKLYNNILKPRISLDVGPKIIGVAYSDSYNHIKGLKDLETLEGYEPVVDQILSYAVNLLNYNTPYEYERKNTERLEEKIEKLVKDLKGISSLPSSSSSSSSASSSSASSSSSDTNSNFNLLPLAKEKKLDIVLSAPMNVKGNFDLNIPNARLSFNLALLLHNKIIKHNLINNIKIYLYDERFTTMEAKLKKKIENNCKFNFYYIRHRY